MGRNGAHTSLYGPYATLKTFKLGDKDGSGTEKMNKMMKELKTQ